MLRNLSFTVASATLIATTLSSTHPKPTDYVLDADTQATFIDSTTNEPTDTPMEKRALCVVNAKILHEMIRRGTRETAELNPHAFPNAQGEAKVVKLLRVRTILARVQVGNGFFAKTCTLTPKIHEDGFANEFVSLDAVNEFVIDCENFRRENMIWPWKQAMRWFWPYLD